MLKFDFLEKKSTLKSNLKEDGCGKNKKERFYVDIIIILVILLSLSNISYSNNIFGSYILEKGILNINIEKITYKNGTEQE